MTPDQVLLVLIGALLLAAVYFFHRLVNSAGKVEWQVGTHHPEPNHVEVTKLEQERDEARRLSERLRAELEGKS